MAVIYHWRHGWIPLTHAAALAKAHGNHKLADKLAKRHGITKARKTPAHINAYHTARQAQNARYENLTGLSAEDTHRQEFKDYFGKGDHSTAGAVEERITFSSHLRDLSANTATERAHKQSYDAGVALGHKHGSRYLGADAENSQFDAAAAKADHSDDFDQGYQDGIVQAYEDKTSGRRTLAPIEDRRDLAAAILSLADMPAQNRPAAVKQIKKRAAELNATDLLPTSALKRTA